MERGTGDSATEKIQLAASLRPGEAVALLLLEYNLIADTVPDRVGAAVAFICCRLQALIVHDIAAIDGAADVIVVASEDR